jgi:lambda family phage minor tail protein L
MGVRSLVGSNIAGSGSTVSTTERLIPPGAGNSTAVAEALAQFQMGVGGSFDRPGANYGSSTSSSRIIGLRKNGATGVDWTGITGSGAGVFVDDAGAAGSLSVAANDLVCLNARTTSGNSTWYGQTANFVSAGSAGVTLLWIGDTAGVAFASASTSRRVGLHGHSAIYADGSTLSRTKIAVSGTLRVPHTYITANACSDAVNIELWENGSATGFGLSVAAGATGMVTSLLGPATYGVTAGNEYDWRVTKGAGGSTFTWTGIGVTLEASSGAKSMVIVRAGAGVSRTGSATSHYMPIMSRGIGSLATEGFATIKPGFFGRLSQIRVLTASAGYDATFTVRKNTGGGAADTAVSVTQSSGASGWAENNSSTVDFNPTDELSISWTGGTSGSTQLHCIALTVEDLSIAVRRASFTGQTDIAPLARARAYREAAFTGSTDLAPHRRSRLHRTAPFTGGTAFAPIVNPAGPPASQSEFTGGTAFSPVSGYVVHDFPIRAEIQTLTPSAKIELFELDAAVLGGPIYRFHAGTNGLREPVTWAGEQYSPFPIQATGFEHSGQGPLPRPRLRVANVAGVMSALVMMYDDLAGCKVERIRTLAKFLDAVNFPGGNPTADPDAEYPREVYYIDRKASEDRDMVEFELASSLDMAGVMFPSRQVVQNYCPWAYRGSECGYTGTSYFDTNDQVAPVLAQDVCGKRLSSCRKRFGQHGELPYGGFPAAGLLRL